MADLPDHGPYEGLSRRRAPPRRLSFASQNSSHSLRQKQLRTQTSNPNIRSRADSETSGIHSPVPRRHLLLQTESQQWLNGPPLSPGTSRPVSPLARPPSGTNSPIPVITPRREHTLSFSSLKELNNRPSRATAASLRAHNESHHMEPEAAAGKRWIRWMHEQGMRRWVVPCAILSSAWIKWCVGLGSYSGAGTPPMYGDYEAQRHWMELTINLPIRRWYTYDLPYWGLDYPPLTAYHSWFFGFIGSQMNTSWFALDTSRGIESNESKSFMRATVLVSDMAVYVPALVLFRKAWHGTRSQRTQNLAFLTLLLQPSLLLIDSGHFQYNSVMLGFTILALNYFAKGQDVLGAICFVLSLGFKQMALYYAPAIGAYLLGKCFHLNYKSGSQLFARLGVATILGFLVLFLPFLPPFAPLSAISNPITRIFPFGRGLFEDKVANFWCASNVAFKWKVWVSTSVLVKLSAAFTALGFLPAVVGLIWGGIKTRPVSDTTSNGQIIKEAGPTPTLLLLPYALLTSSMSFFLFSFQVHEKTILLPLMPLTLLLSGAAPDSSAFEWGVLANNVGVFSMWPLLKKDGLGVQYVALTLLWNWVIGYNPLRPRKSLSFILLLSLAVYAAIAGLHVMELIVTPPPRYPDLFPVLNVLVSTPVFVLTWLWSIKRGIEVSWALGGVGVRSPPKKDAKCATQTPPVEHNTGKE